MASFTENLETTKKSLISIGFSLEEAEGQLEKVGKIITMAILQRLLKEKAPEIQLTPDNLKNYLEKNFNTAYIREVIDIESDKIVAEYLAVVTNKEQ